MAARKRTTKSRAKTTAKTTAKKPKLGSGTRFKKVAASAKKSGARNPQAVAASAGRKKYGAKKMTKMATTGRRRATRRK